MKNTLDDFNNKMFELLENITNPEPKQNETEEQALKRTLDQLNGACKVGEMILGAAKIQSEFAINAARFNLETPMVPNLFGKKTDQDNHKQLNKGTS